MGTTGFYISDQTPKPMADLMEVSIKAFNPSKVYFYLDNMQIEKKEAI